MSGLDNGSDRWTSICVVFGRAGVLSAVYFGDEQAVLQVSQVNRHLFRQVRAMRKSIHFAVVVLASIGTIGLGGGAVGAVSGQFEQAETYKQNQQYELAEAIYKDIATNLPGTDEALQARPHRK